eukprot:CAMPEP_0179177786 /NCGR_PEP_ID=MMETSP0796-20121207/87929_1 /TAXON_ID=73915 /ORGANISM="Pyrodinium bahamense, Strain pbaha01" /LENGTH=62 /DNA_ID=CAMNT_0020881347 /DNA_START=30 /DNA_END=218 /DNA_ORIENTATION=-
MQHSPQTEQWDAKTGFQRLHAAHQVSWAPNFLGHHRPVSTSVRANSFGSSEAFRVFGTRPGP